MKFRKVVMLALLIGSTGLLNAAHAHGGIDGDAVVGGALGGAAGAAVGSAIGGRDMAMVGGALGAAAGVSLNTRSRYDDGRRRGYYDDRHDRGYHRGYYERRHRHHHDRHDW